MKKTTISIVAAAIILISATAESSLAKGNNNLEKRLKKLEAQIAELSKESEEIKKSQAKSHNSNANVASILGKAQIFGRLQVDANWYDENQDTDIRRDGIDIARVRLGIKGELTDNLNYKFENDFAENASEVKDAFIAYTGFKNSTITFGQSKPTFSLEILESSNHMAFIQRASVSDDAVLGRRVGIKADKRGDIWDWRIAGGVFGEEVGNEARDDDTKYSYTARASVAPINNAESLLHFGVATSFTSRDRKTANGTHDSLDQETLIGGELIARYKLFTLQSEYIANNTKYDSDAAKSTGENANFPGYYVQASVFLTGEQRKYSKKAAKLGKIKVASPADKGGLGAIELAARFSHLDKNDKSIEEGSSNNYTLGVNWYMNNNVRLMLNYLKSETSYIIEDSEGYDAVSLRTRIYF